FLVVRYTFGTAATATDCKLWVNPSSATFGAASEPAATLVSTTASGQTDISGLASWTLLQRSVNQPNFQIVDELRVGASWAGVTGGPEISFHPANRVNNAGTTATFSAPA